jgi:hypothetical protein
MPDYTKLYRSITSDRDFRAIDRNAQHLYFWLLASPSLNYAGICDWRPARLTGLWPGAPVDDIRESAEVLRHGHFLFTSDATEEALFRTYVKRDGALKQKNLGASTARDFHNIASDTLRCILRWELHKFREDQPDLSGWVSLVDILKETAVHPDEDPGIDPTIYRQRREFEGQFPAPIAPEIEGQFPDADPPATTTTPTTNNSHLSPDKSRPTSRPTTRKADEPPEGFDEFWRIYIRRVKKPAAIKAYRKALTRTDAATINAGAALYIAGELKRPDYSLTYIAHPSTWLNDGRWDDERAGQAASSGQSASGLSHVDDLREPPDGLSNAELSAWYAADRKRRGV